MSEDSMSDKKMGLVPRLRFPEFQKAGEWEQKQLEPYLAGYSERILATDNNFPIYSSTREGLKLQKEYYDGREIANEGEYGIVPVDYFVYRHMSDDTIFKFNINDTGGSIAVSKEYPVFKTLDLNSRFLFYSLNEGDEFKKFAETQRKGGTRTRLYFKVLCKCHILLPSLIEQKKIAACLSSLDALITAQAEKLDALKTHKAGLMQQLFPREGETVPRLRFAEFREAGEWEQVELGKIAEIKLGKMLDSKKHTSGKLLPYLNNLSVRWNQVDTSDLPRMYFDEDELDRFGLKAGDVVVCEGGEPGRSAVWDGSLPNVKYQKAVHRVRFNVPFVPQLLVNYLELIAGSPRFEKLFTGGGIKHLTRETFAQLQVPYFSHAEQQKIAACLSSLDALITAQTEKLDALKTHKKGLMQQLFPTHQS